MQTQLNRGNYSKQHLVQKKIHHQNDIQRNQYQRQIDEQLEKKHMEQQYKHLSKQQQYQQQYYSPQYDQGYSNKPKQPNNRYYQQKIGNNQSQHQINQSYIQDNGMQNNRNSSLPQIKQPYNHNNNMNNQYSIYGQSNIGDSTIASGYPMSLAQQQQMVNNKKTLSFGNLYNNNSQDIFQSNNAGGGNTNVFNDLQQYQNNSIFTKNNINNNQNGQQNDRFQYQRPVQQESHIPYNNQDVLNIYAQLNNDGQSPINQNFQLNNTLAQQQLEQQQLQNQKNNNNKNNQPNNKTNKQYVYNLQNNEVQVSNYNGNQQNQKSNLHNNNQKGKQNNHQNINSKHHDVQFDKNQGQTNKKQQNQKITDRVKTPHPFDNIHQNNNQNNQQQNKSKVLNNQKSPQPKKNIQNKSNHYNNNNFDNNSHQPKQNYQNNHNNYNNNNDMYQQDQVVQQKRKIISKKVAKLPVLKTKSQPQPVQSSPRIQQIPKITQVGRQRNSQAFLYDQFQYHPQQGFNLCFDYIDQLPPNFCQVQIETYLIDDTFQLQEIEQYYHQDQQDSYGNIKDIVYLNQVNNKDKQRYNGSIKKKLSQKLTMLNKKVLLSNIPNDTNNQYLLIQLNCVTKDTYATHQVWTLHQIFDNANELDIEEGFQNSQQGQYYQQQNKLEQGLFKLPFYSNEYTPEMLIMKKIPFISHFTINLRISTPQNHYVNIQLQDESSYIPENQYSFQLLHKKSEILSLKVFKNHEKHQLQEELKDFIRFNLNQGKGKVQLQERDFSHLYFKYDIDKLQNKEKKIQQQSNPLQHAKQQEQILKNINDSIALNKSKQYKSKLMEDDSSFNNDSFLQQQGEYKEHKLKRQQQAGSQDKRLQVKNNDIHVQDQEINKKQPQHIANLYNQKSEHEKKKRKEMAMDQYKKRLNKEQQQGDDINQTQDDIEGSKQIDKKVDKKPKLVKENIRDQFKHVAWESLKFDVSETIDLGVAEVINYHQKYPMVLEVTIMKANTHIVDNNQQGIFIDKMIYPDTSDKTLPFVLEFQQLLSIQRLRQEYPNELGMIYIIMKFSQVGNNSQKNGNLYGWYAHQMFVRKNIKSKNKSKIDYVVNTGDFTVNLRDAPFKPYPFNVNQARKLEEKVIFYLYDETDPIPTQPDQQLPPQQNQQQQQQQQQQKP